MRGQQCMIQPNRGPHTQSYKNLKLPSKPCMIPKLQLWLRSLAIAGQLRMQVETGAFQPPPCVNSAPNCPFWAALSAVNYCAGCHAMPTGSPPHFTFKANPHPFSKFRRWEPEYEGSSSCGSLPTALILAWDMHQQL